MKSIIIQSYTDFLRVDASASKDSCSYANYNWLISNNAIYSFFLYFPNVDIIGICEDYRINTNKNIITMNIINNY